MVEIHGSKNDLRAHNGLNGDWDSSKLVAQRRLDKLAVREALEDMREEALEDEYYNIWANLDYEWLEEDAYDEFLGFFE